MKALCCLVRKKKKCQVRQKGVLKEGKESSKLEALHNDMFLACQHSPHFIIATPNDELLCPSW